MSEQYREKLVEMDRLYKEQFTKRDSLWDLVISIHSLPALREWITIESVPLLPLVSPLKEETPGNRKTALIHLLITIPEPGSQDNSLKTPWAYVCWLWPSKRLLAMVDIFGWLDSGGALTAEHICTKEFADATEKALQDGAPMPKLPIDLESLYLRVMDNLKPPPAGNRALKESSGTESAESIKSEPGGVPAKSDLTVRSRILENLIAECKTLLGQIGNESLKQELRRIKSRMSDQVFSVAVVGEFCRGKSTIVNSLLGQALIPVGYTPTTTMLARIRHGPSPKLYLVKENGETEEFDLSDDAWARFQSFPTDRDHSEFLVIELPNEWLALNKLNLIDTPGVGGVLDSRTALIAQTIASCKAMLIAVDSTMAMSLTERVFLEEHILAQTIPLLAVVLTKLDLISGSEKASVIQYVRGKLTEWAPKALLYSSISEPELEADHLIDGSGPEQIRRLISSWAVDEQRIYFSLIQAAYQMRTLMALTLDFLQTQRQSLSATQDEQLRAIRDAQGALDRMRLEWGQLQLELKNKELALEDWIETTMAGAKDSILESMSYQLAHSRDPQEWWEKDLPFLLKQHMVGLWKNLETTLQSGIREDADRVITELERRLDWNWSPGGAGQRLGVDEAPMNVPSADFKTNLSKDRTIARIATAGLTVGALLTFGAPMLIVGTLAGIASETIMNRKVEEQRSQLSEMLISAVEKVISASANHVRAKVRNIYRNLVNQAQQQEKTWYELRLAAIKGNNSGPDNSLASVEQHISAADRIIVGLSNWIQGGIDR